ncbi:MAG: hypothetical protein JRH20_14335 [Deltaproteobacteria bacterium]|nr:hypothetical protein [Deltaproteobacteria bacterium]
MQNITRRNFVDRLAQAAPININEVNDPAREALEKAGVDAQALRRAAGADGQIRGRTELRRLFTSLDRADSDGSRRSVMTHGDDGQPTRTGKACVALLKLAAAQGAKASQRGILHVHMRSSARVEAEVLRRENRPAAGGVKVLAGAVSRQVVVSGEAHNTRTASGLSKLGHALCTQGMPVKQAKAFITLLKGERAAKRALLVEVGLSLYAIGRGELPVNRLVLSGHHVDDGVAGELGYPRLSFSSITKLARTFPGGAKKIEHLALATCKAGYSANVARFRRAFPNLKSLFGYHASSPLAEGGGASHLKRWERMTDGDDPSQVDPGRLKHVATWNIADGYQGKKAEPLKTLERRVTKLRREGYDPISAGEALNNDMAVALDDYHQALTDLLHHRDLQPERRATVKAHAHEVLKMRHPELFRRP